MKTTYKGYCLEKHRKVGKDNRYDIYRVEFESDIDRMKRYYSAYSFDQKLWVIREYRNTIDMVAGDYHEIIEYLIELEDLKK